METKRLILAVLFLIPFGMKAQFDPEYIAIDSANLVVMYELNYKEDTTMIQYHKQEKMILLIGDTLSCFQSNGHYVSDKMWKNGAWQQMITEGTIRPTADMITAFHYYILKRKKTATITVLDYVFMTGAFEYEESMNMFDWKITSETDEYQGFIIQKAVTSFGGRDWEAWFAPGLPLNDGPYKFCGLPGLIVKIADKQNHYNFKMLSIEKPLERTPIEISDKIRTKTTKMKFFKVDDDCRDNILENAKSIGNSNETSQKLAKGMQAKNNPIELDRK